VQNYADCKIIGRPKLSFIENGVSGSTPFQVIGFYLFLADPTAITGKIFK